MGGLFRQIVTPFYFPWQVAKNSFCFLNDRPVAPVGLALFLCSTRIVRVDALQVRPERFLPVLTWTASSFGRSRPAADAAREVTERWLLDGLDVSVGHRRCSRDPSQKNDAGGTPAS